MPSYDKTQHRVRLIGRSKTEDIVNCSPDVDAVGYFVTSKTIEAAARTFCNSYGVGVVLPDGEADLPPNAQYISVIAGYSAYFVIEELARSVGMLVWDDAVGNLVISASSILPSRV